MRVLFIPIGNEDIKIDYAFEGERVTASIGEVSDTFDFSGTPNGELQLRDDNEDELIETVLDVNPIMSAKRENGELSVELINFIGTDASYEESFPTWIDAKDYKAGERNG